jgi:methylphosphotriester-DNA--protein-cysteine methyltransferase
MDVPAGTAVTRAWKPPIEGLREVFHATFSTHAYPPHTHDAWTVFTPTQIARAFSDVFGISPHGSVIGRRLEAARDRILGGQPLADVAAEVGFHDQAHLSRRFSQFPATTPGRFRGAGRMP